MHIDSRNVVVWVPRLVQPQTREVLSISKVIKLVTIPADGDGDIMIIRSGSVCIFRWDIYRERLHLNIL